METLDPSPFPPNQGWENRTFFSRTYTTVIYQLPVIEHPTISERIKWNSKPHPSKIKDEPVQNKPYYLIFDFEGGGSLLFYFTLSNIAILDKKKRTFRPTHPPPQQIRDGKMVHFGLCMGSSLILGRGHVVPFYSLPDCRMLNHWQQLEYYRV